MSKHGGDFISTANPNALIASAISKELFANPAKSLSLSNTVSDKDIENANQVLSNWNLNIKKKQSASE
jgi:hypothetical protein